MRPSHCRACLVPAVTINSSVIRTFASWANGRSLVFACILRAEGWVDAFVKFCYVCIDVVLHNLAALFEDVVDEVPNGDIV